MRFFHFIAREIVTFLEPTVIPKQKVENFKEMSLFRKIGY